MNYALFRAVHRRMKDDPRLDFEFSGRDGHQSNSAKMYQVAGLEGGRVVSNLRRRFARYDLFVACNFRTLPWRARWKIQTYHGLSPVNSFLRKPERIANYDRLFLYGPHMKRRLVETGALREDDPKMAMIGWPKLDALVNGSLNREEILLACGMDPSRKTVLYAPGCKEKGSLGVAGVEIVTCLQKMGLNILVKLHDRSRDPFSEKGDWGQRLTELGLSNLRLVQDFDAVPYMYVADMMITDVSSISYEYCVLDRPMIIFDVPGAMDNYIDMDQAVWQQDHGSLVSRVEDICPAVEEGFENPERLSEIRCWKASELYYKPGTAVDRAVNAMYQLLELAPPMDH